jgi:hypothetical protein
MEWTCFSPVSRYGPSSVCCPVVSIPPTVATDAPEWRPPSWRTRLVVLGLAATLFGVLGLTGGLDRVPPPAAASTPTALADQTVDAGPWRATVTKAVASGDISDQYRASKKGNWLLLIAIKLDLTNYSPDSLASSHFFEAVTVRDLPGLVNPEPKYMLLTRDATVFEFLNPGLPEQVLFVFEVAQSTPVPKQVTVVLRGHDVSWSWTYQRLEWSQLTPKVLVSMDVSNKIGTS